MSTPPPRRPTTAEALRVWAGLDDGSAYTAARVCESCQQMLPDLDSTLGDPR